METAEATKEQLKAENSWSEKRRHTKSSFQKILRKNKDDCTNVQGFLKQEIHPRLDEIDSMKNPALMPQLLDKAGELGLLGTSVPQELGGFGMDFNTTMLVAEVLGAGHSLR